MRLYINPDDDERQDREIGDFRGRARDLVGKSESILEIGPSHMPVFPRVEGFSVSILDHASATDLRTKYRAIGVDPSRIEDVDFVWTGGPISAAVDGRRFKFVFASHVVEHMTDLLGFLDDARNLLVEDGRLILIVPDHRYCFDLFQPTTDVAKAIGDHLSNRSVHSFEALYREEAQASVTYAGKDTIAWWQGDVERIKLMRGDPVSRLASSEQAAGSSRYEDAHEYYFTPSSFLLIVEEARYLGLMGMEVETLTRARGCEFLAILKQSNSKPRTTSEFLALKQQLSLNTLREKMEAWQRLLPLTERVSMAL